MVWFNREQHRRLIMSRIADLGLRNDNEVWLILYLLCHPKFNGLTYLERGIASYLVDMSRPTISSAMKTLEKKGYIKMIRGSFLEKTPNSYRLAGEVNFKKDVIKRLDEALI